MHVREPHFVLCHIDGKPHVGTQLLVGRFASISAIQVNHLQDQRPLGNRCHNVQSNRPTSSDDSISARHLTRREKQRMAPPHHSATPLHDVLVGNCTYWIKRFYTAQGASQRTEHRQA